MIAMIDDVSTTAASELETYAVDRPGWDHQGRAGLLVLGLLVDLLMRFVDLHVRLAASDGAELAPVALLSGVTPSHNGRHGRSVRRLALTAEVGEGAVRWDSGATFRGTSRWLLSGSERRRTG